MSSSYKSTRKHYRQSRLQDRDVIKGRLTELTALGTSTKRGYCQKGFLWHVQQPHNQQLANANQTHTRIASDYHFHPIMYYDQQQTQEFRQGVFTGNKSQIWGAAPKSLKMQLLIFISIQSNEKFNVQFQVMVRQLQLVGYLVMQQLATSYICYVIIQSRVIHMYINVHLQ